MEHSENDKNNTKNASNEYELNPKIDSWEKKLNNALIYYQPIIDNMDDNYEAFKGTRAIYNSKGVKANKQKTSVRKVVFELIETQVDVNIPQPKVTSVKGELERAQTIEYYIKNELDRLPFEKINDEQARITPVIGSSIFLVEWDNSVKTRNTVGKLMVSNIHPKEIVPQPGVYDIDKMDYIFIRLLQSKLEIYNKYGKDVSNEGNSETNDPTHNEDLVTHNYVYYKNKEGNISVFSWVNNIVIQDIDNYFSRKQKVCKKCGLSPSECSCENSDFELKDLKYEKIMMPTISVDPMTGQQFTTEKEIKVPYYIPKKYPLIFRTNASDVDSLLGSSDVEAIKDQQNDLSIFMTKIREKLLKSGSIVTIPETINFKATDEEMKIVKVKDPAQVNMIEAKALQSNVNNDISLLSLNYEIARQTIGITDSFQGRRDTTAVSGKAKEFAAQQTAGRLDSKVVMKQFAYSQLFEVMFQFMLAFADEPRYYNFQNNAGELEYGMFDKRKFIDQDDNGEYYYDDEFIFAVDVSATLSTNRKAMWEETRLNFTSGAYGNPQDINTIVMFWQMMDAQHYPGAKAALQFASQRAQQQQEMAAQQQAINNEQADKKLAVDALGKMNKNTGQTTS